MKNEQRPLSRSRRGSVLLTTLIITLSLSTLLGALVGYSLHERRMNYRHALRLEAKNAAEAVVEYGLAQLRYKFDNRTNVDSDALEPGTADALVPPDASYFGPHVDPDSLHLVGGTIPANPTLQYIDPNNPANEFDRDKGKRVYARTISVFGSATVESPTGGPPITSYAVEQLSVRDIPLFSHAIFYNPDLEIFPGPVMYITGPVHSNGDLYVANQGGNSLNFQGPVTVAGNVYHAWKNNVHGAHNSETLGESPVNFVNRDGNLVNMKQGQTWKDSRMGTSSLSPDFRAYASNTWNGNLQTADHGITDYNPPAFPDYAEDDLSTPAYDPVNSGHDLIEPPLPPSDPDYSAEQESQKMSSKACLYIKVPVSGSGWHFDFGTPIATKSDGTPVTLPDDLLSLDPNAMRDNRRGFNVNLVNLDVSRLKQVIESPVSGDPDRSIGDFDPAEDWNGVVYVEVVSTDNNPELNRTGVRLIHGSEVPSRSTPLVDEGFTFATNDALYVLGNYNADGNLSTGSPTEIEPGEVPAALFGDSVTLLSSAWSDSGSKQSGYPVRSAASGGGEVAAAIVTGIMPSGAKGMMESSGGAHNLPRFLENWSGKKCVIRGSLVCLYESEVDDSTWDTNYYSPPNRTWGFSDLFAGGTFPPGTPLVRDYRRIDYRELTRDEYESAVAALSWP